MKKITGIIDRFEEQKGVVRASGEDMILPKSALEGFKEGDSVTVVIASAEESTEDSNKVAKALVADLFKEE